MASNASRRPTRRRRQPAYRRLVAASCVVAAAAAELLPLSLAGTAVAVAAAAAAEGRETCAAGDAGGSGSCSSAQGRGLRWRGFPYHVRDPRYKRTIYGGDYVKRAFALEGFEGPVEGDDWDLLWTHRTQRPSFENLGLAGSSARQEDAAPARRRATDGASRLVNHCDYFVAAGDKCRFAKHASLVSRLTSSSPSATSSATSATSAADAEAAATSRYLATFELDDPAQLVAWQRQLQAAPERHWLLKPCAAGNSQGIQLLRGRELLSMSNLGTHVVAQEYLEDPYLGFGGSKFHLRLYVLVTDWSQPTSAFLYDDGLIFRSKQAYRREGVARSVASDVFSGITASVEALPLADLWSHLGADAAGAVRQRLRRLLRELLSEGLQESFGAFSAQSGGLACFDVFGADVMLDAKLLPTVLEFNTGPNLWVDDHGKENQGRLAGIKRPLIEQIVSWSARRLRGDAQLAEAALKNFTRLNK
eukprot:TRINITY_DN25896_c0_g2_i1.p1 TRINITY_DN25896_c0_g2~~TRINITY_DN25896_c0_g2_i1.p1  ORF type:complete len:485 (-),score=108.70 TRINITY_DN25896_c0_g2_i1:22-1449(-)